MMTGDEYSNDDDNGNDDNFNLQASNQMSSNHMDRKKLRSYFRLVSIQAHRPSKTYSRNLSGDFSSAQI